MPWRQAAQFQDRCLEFIARKLKSQDRRITHKSVPNLVRNAIPTFISSEFDDLLEVAVQTWESEILTISDFGRLTHIFLLHEENEASMRSADCWQLLDDKFYIQTFVDYDGVGLTASEPLEIQLPCAINNHEWLQVCLRLTQQKIAAEKIMQLPRQMKRQRKRKNLGQATDVKVLMLREIEYITTNVNSDRASPRIHRASGYWARRGKDKKQTWNRESWRGSGAMMPKYKGINITRTGE